MNPGPWQQHPTLIQSAPPPPNTASREMGDTHPSPPRPPAACAPDTGAPVDRDLSFADLWRDDAMHAEISRHRSEIGDLCRRYDVARLAIFGSAARGDDFDPARSDADFLVEFAPDSRLSPLDQFFDLAAGLEALLGRHVDLVERGAVETSRNYIRRRRILAEAQPLYG
jgi:predicted nucleotidyltransferase